MESHILEILNLSIEWKSNLCSDIEYDLSTPKPFHTWALILLGCLILHHPTFKHHFRILEAIECYKKWVDAILMKKESDKIVANFVIKHINFD